ncbi:MAG TPA: HAMP domain-containing sensor histidine kinase [Myxococcaceae bacterium]|nr:HAMP domain-containing sensor histidine kinase [Myxococcaceae bacterium]
MIRQPRLALLMALALAAVTALAFWDEERESAAALDDFAQEQSRASRMIAAELAGRLEYAVRDARMLAAELQRPGEPVTLPTGYRGYRFEGGPSTGEPPHGTLAIEVTLPDGRRVEMYAETAVIFAGLRRLERPGTQEILVARPGDPRLWTTDGSAGPVPFLASALEAHQGSLRLKPLEAASLGLPARTAFAGLSTRTVEGAGTWGAVVVATAERERDRERRARWRLVLAVGIGCGLVLAFGGVALRNQRRELELARELEVARLLRERDERLEREGQAATVLTLAGGVAHEISTPLSVIVGRSEQLLERLEGDERARRSLQAVLDQCQRINAVVRGFLALARGGTPELSDTDPADVVEGAVALVEHRFRGSGVTLTSDVAPGLPHLRANHRLLEHALVNLLLNACDACAPGGRVVVRAVQRGSEVALSVRDDGAGIAPEAASRATEPFFTTKKPGQGTGLGLSIVSEIVKTHRGSLVIGSASGRGTEATITLPAGPEVLRAAHA